MGRVADARTDPFRATFNPGDILVREGERGEEFYLLEKGVLDVSIQGRKVGSIDAAAGQDFFGEIGAVLGQPRTATVSAKTECVVLRLPKIELQTIIQNSPSLGVKLVKSLSRKLAESAHAVAEYQVHNHAVRRTGSTEFSLRNHLKGVLHLMERAAAEPSPEKTGELLDFFLTTNPWGLRQGENNDEVKAYLKARRGAKKTAADEATAENEK
jgi:CRP-like cAMP-binding protein